MPKPTGGYDPVDIKTAFRVVTELMESGALDVGTTTGNLQRLLQLPAFAGADADDLRDLVVLVNSWKSKDQFYSCFISYSTRDQEFASCLHADLENRGIRCWFAPKEMAGGKKIHEQIDEAIRSSDRVLLILSENSMRSEWVRTEIAKTRKRASAVTQKRPMMVTSKPANRK